MRTTLDLPDETFRQLKSQAALSGMKLKELVTQLIERGLAAGVTANQAAQPPGPPPTYPIPIARDADGTVTPYLTNAQLHAVLEEEDLAHYKRVRSGASGQ
jgi:hypothetical protein